ncbi:hypothetical protein ABKA04_000375 [Annulohypoxylon sp. FPYF3050]
MKRKAVELAEGMPSPRRSEESFNADVANTDDANVATPAVEVSDDVTGSNNTQIEPAADSQSTKRRKKYPSDEKLHVCDYILDSGHACGTAFNRPCRLEDHKRQVHTLERPFHCDKCTASFSQKKQLKAHYKDHDGGEQPRVICSIEGCGKTFSNQAHANRHVGNQHTKINPLQCHDYPPCDKVFRKAETLAQHIRVEHQKLPGFPCDVAGDGPTSACEEMFDSASALRRHKERQHSEGPSKFFCEKCQLVGVENGFSTKVQLNKHIQDNHPQFICPTCSEAFANQSDLIQHISLHKKEKQERVPCIYPGCTSSYSKYSNMMAHYTREHQGKSFVCGEFDVSRSKGLEDWPQSAGCRKNFSTKGNLEIHIRHHHLGIPRPKKDKGKANPNPNPNPHPNPNPTPTPNPNPHQTSRELLDTLAGVARAARRSMRCGHNDCESSPYTFANRGELQEHLQSAHNVDPRIAQGLAESHEAELDIYKKIARLYNPGDRPMTQQSAASQSYFPLPPQSSFTLPSQSRPPHAQQPMSYGNNPLIRQSNPIGHAGPYNGQFDSGDFSQELPYGDSASNLTHMYPPVNRQPQMHQNDLVAANMAPVHHEPQHEVPGTFHVPGDGETGPLRSAYPDPEDPYGYERENEATAQHQDVQQQDVEHQEQVVGEHEAQPLNVQQALAEGHQILDENGEYIIPEGEYIIQDGDEYILPPFGENGPWIPVDAAREERRERASIQLGEDLLESLENNTMEYYGITPGIMPDLPDDSEPVPDDESLYIDPALLQKVPEQQMYDDPTLLQRVLEEEKQKMPVDPVLLQQQEELDRERERKREYEQYQREWEQAAREEELAHPVSEEVRRQAKEILTPDYVAELDEVFFPRFGWPLPEAQPNAQPGAQLNAQQPDAQQPGIQQSGLQLPDAQLVARPDAQLNTQPNAQLDVQPDSQHQNE